MRLDQRGCLRVAVASEIEATKNRRGKKVGKGRAERSTTTKHFCGLRVGLVGDCALVRGPQAGFEGEVTVNSAC